MTSLVQFTHWYKVTLDSDVFLRVVTDDFNNLLLSGFSKSSAS